MHRRSDLEQRDHDLTRRLHRDRSREPHRRPAQLPKQRWAFQAWAADVISESAPACNAAGVLQPPVKIGGRP